MKFKTLIPKINKTHNDRRKFQKLFNGNSSKTCRKRGCTEKTTIGGQMDLIEGDMGCKNWRTKKEIEREVKNYIKGINDR